MEKARVSAYRWVPPLAQGLVRDLRVRWALEEAGVPFEVNLISLGEEQKSDAYRELQPFGQVPALEIDGISMFESGAAVMHVAEQSEALMPKDPAGRAHVRTWMFAALNTVEPPIWMLNVLGFRGGEASKAELRPPVVELIERRLDEVAKFLGDRDWLVADRFTAADLLMVSVLRILRNDNAALVEKRPTLDRYKKRGEARPGFQKSLTAQMAAFEKNTPPKS